MTLPINANLVSNPSFKDGVIGWEALTATIEALPTGGYNSGPECLQVIKTVEEYSGAQSTKTISINARGESNVYSASAYVHIPTGYQTGTLMLSILWYTQGMTYIGSSDSTPTSVTASSSTWTRLTKANATPPANARYAAVRVVQTTSGNAGEVFLLDAVKLEVGSVVTAFQEFIDQGEENAVVNRGLTKVPFPHLTGMQLNADIVLGDMTFNTIDNEGYVYVITDITGMFGTPETEFAEMSRGLYKDGDYDTRGRYKARFINLTGSILVPGPEYVSDARDKIIRATDLVRSGAWLKLKPKNEPVKALFVRLNGGIQTTVVNPRGRIDFSVGLKAADPVLYEWNEERVDGYSVANVYASNYAGYEVGSVEVGTSGNYAVGGIFEIRGPILGSNATIFNYTNGDLATITGSVRGERYREITQKKLEESTATLKFSQVHDFVAGDELYVALANSIAVANVARGSGNTYATIGSTYASAYSNGDKVVLANVDSSLDNQLLTISNVTSTSFTVPSSNTTALSNTSLTSATANNQTNELFNGSHIVVSTPNNKAVIYYIDSRDGVSLANVSNSDSATMRNVVYRDADYLEVDTANNEVALNGMLSGARGYLDALIDWVKLEAGNNVVELDDSGQLPMYVEKRTILSNGLATLYTSVPHGLKVGDNIHVDYVGSPYDTPSRADITYYSRSGYTATITANSHGFSNDDTVVISSVSRGVDGRYAIANVTTNTFTVTTSSSDTVYSTPVLGVAKKIIPVTYYAKTNNTVTLTVANAAIFSVNDPLYVTGVSEEADGQVWLTNVNTTANTIAYYTTGRKPAGKITSTAAPSGAQVAFRYPVTSATEYSLTYNTLESASAETNVLTGMLAYTENGGYTSVVGYSRQLNVATITTKTKHGYSVGDFVTVSGNVNTSFNVATGNQVNAASYTISGNTVTLVTASNHNLVTNDTATIYGIDTGVAGIDINGTYAVTNVNATTISYSLDSALKLSYPTAGRSLTSSVATLYLSQTPEFEELDSDGNPTKVTVTGLGSPFDGTFELSGVQVRNNTITYTCSSSDVPYADNTSGAAALTYNGSPERAFVYQKNEILYYTINASSTDGTNNVTGTYAHIYIQNDPGLVVGDYVEITGVSGIVDGVRKIISIATDSSTYSRYKFAVKIENSTVVERKTATLNRASGSHTMTVTSSGHGRTQGDWIYLNSQNEASVADKKYQVKTVANTNAFTIYTTETTTHTTTAVQYWYPLKQNAYATKAFPILAAPAPTDYTFSYPNPNTTPNVANTAVTRSGEVVQQSDARMKIYYRSGWIG